MRWNRTLLFSKYLIYFILVFTVFISSCDLIKGRAGDDGKAYIALDWLSGCKLYYNFSELPSYIIKKQYYEHKPGTYSASYYLYDYTLYEYSSVWTLTYTITANKGLPGEIFFKEGADGANNYFCIYCGFYIGPSIYGPSLTPLSTLIKNDTNNNIVDEVHKEFRQGYSTIKLDAYRKKFSPEELEKMHFKLNK